MASQYRRRSLMLNTIAKVAQGNPTIITDSSSRRLKRLDIYGQSEQDSTTGAQLLDPSLFEADETTNGITYTTNEDGSIKVEGTATNSANKYLGEYIDIFENGQTYTCNLTQNGYTGGFNITHNDDRHDYLSTLTVDKSTMISIKPYIKVGTDVTKNETIYPMVNKGESILPFEPYTGGKPSPSPDYPQEIISKKVSEIKLYGTNLFDLEKEKLVSITNWNEERQCFYPKNGAYYISMKVNEAWDIAHESGNILTISFDIKANKNGKVRVYSLGNRQFNLVSETSNFDVTQEYVRHYARFLTVDKIGQPDMTGQGDNCALSFYGVVDGESVIPEVKNICISVTENTEYIPFESQVITLSEPITLRGIPVASGGNVTIDGQQYISDVITEKDGVIGVERNLNELLVSSLGNTEVTQGAHTNGQNYLACHTGNAKRQIKPMSNRYIGNTYTMENNYVYIPSTAGFVITDSRFIDKETAISIITEEQTKVVYVLETPTFEPLPDEVQAQYKALKSYYPNTVVQTGCWNEVTYSAKRGG